MKSLAKRLFFLPLFYILYELSGNLSNDMYLPAFLQIQHTLGTKEGLVKLTISSWLLGMGIAQLILGPLCDRFGRRAVMAAGGILYILATMGCALAPNIYMMIVARVFQGIGVGSIMISGYASIHDLYDDHRATLILAWTSSAAVVAPAIGPLLGSLVLKIGHWRLIFWILCGAGALFLSLVLCVLPESLQQEKRHSLHPVHIFSTYRKIISTRGFLLRSLSFGLLYSGMIAWITASPYMVMDLFKYSPTAFGFLQIPVFVGFIVGAQLVRLFIKILSRERLIILGLICSGCGALAMLLSAWLLSQTLWGILGSMTLYAFGFGLSAAPLNRESLIAAKALMGMTTAIFFLLMSSTGMLISIVISILPDQPAILAGIICLIIALSTLLYFRKDSCVTRSSGS